MTLGEGALELGQPTELPIFKDKDDQTAQDVQSPRKLDQLICGIRCLPRTLVCEIRMEKEELWGDLASFPKVLGRNKWGILKFGLVSVPYLVGTWVFLDSVMKAPHPTGDQIKQYGIDYGPATPMPTPTLKPTITPTPKPR